MMIVDASAASACLEFLCSSFCACIESFLVSLGIRNGHWCAEECWHNDNELECLRNKTDRIERCLFAASSNSVDLWELRELALSDGGLVRAGYRQKAWPKLVGLVEEDTDTVPELIQSPTSLRSSSSSSISSFAWSPSHNDSSLSLPQEEKKHSEMEMEASVDLIRRDAGRSVIFRYHTEPMTGSPAVPPFASERLAQVLENTIRNGNSSSSSLHYYQGLHDIAGVVLHNMDYQVDATTQILQRISRSHLRDAMRENFSNINWFLSVLLPPLVEKVDPYVHYSLQIAQVELSTVCLPWMITWFTHDIHDPETAGRLVDAFLSGHPLMPIYFAVALITHPLLKQELLNIDSEDVTSIFVAIKGMPQRLKTSTDDDGGVLHPHPHQNVSLQEVLEDCITIMNRMPPRSLLDLVDSNSYSRSELLRRISSISLFKAPASWSMASGGLPRSWKELSEIEGTTYCVRAKLASGVPMLMNTVSQSTVIQRKSWGSRKYTQKRKTLKIKKLVRIILGDSTCTNNSIKSS
eukprot:CAMPEP_0172389478 /NCGR_PEP_ID=MMETSP1061-20121228/6358_1 /TAXON_ID=37318 /ORGANISM="Pseudo-nitzschia pungens, Strain cf. pungens" /LENGTH=521 /DNA_ID=CAMNT_0013119649 /DNA_START=12 /DNA_END=1577 /DNA_ORIENTATION=-